MVEAVAEDAMMRVFDKIYTVRKEESIASWVMRITANVAKNYLRRSEERHMHQELVDEEPTRSARGPSAGNKPPDQILMSRERSVLLYKAIADLPDSLRVPFVLRRLDGLPSRTIAEILGLSEGAVDSRIFRAYQRLKDLLPELDE